MDTAVFNALRRVQQEQDEGRRAELRSETAEDLGQHFFRHSADMEELAFDLLNLAWSDAYNEDIVGQLIESKTVGLGDPDWVDEDLRGMRAYWQGKGGQILSDLIRYERHQMPREEIVASLDMHQDELQLDFWGAFDKLTSQAQSKMRTVPVQKLIELIQTAITSGIYYGTFPVATMTDTQLDAILDQVAMRSDGAVSIVGTQLGIRRLSNIGLDFGPNIQERIFETGQIATYKGYPVVQINNFQNFEGQFVLPNDEIWFVGKKAGRLTYYGPQAKVQQLKLPSFYFRWETARDAGMLLYGVARGRLGRVVLT